MHRCGNFAAFLQPNYEKSVGKGCAKITFSRWCPYSKGRAILGGALEWKGTLRVPPQPGCPRVCPPWAHRSYATGSRQAFFPLKCKAILPHMGKESCFLPRSTPFPSFSPKCNATLYPSPQILAHICVGKDSCPFKCKTPINPSQQFFFFLLFSFCLAWTEFSKRLCDHSFCT